MLAPLGAGIDITVAHRTPAGRDSHGNETFTTTTTTYSGCGFWPGSAGRNVAGSNAYGITDFRNTVVTRAQVVLPDGAVVSNLDVLTLPDGSPWRAVGEPQQWSSQLTGATSGVEVAIERVDG